jgi:hypothetical protein
MLNDELPPGRSERYHAYLLRVWYEDGYGWRVSLQCAETRERFGFADLQSAMIFVEQLLLEGKLE